MMPLTLADPGKENTIVKIGGSAEVIYKCIGAAEGEAVILPKNPELAGHKFIGWKRENGEMLSLDDNNGIVTSDEKLSAVFE